MQKFGTKQIVFSAVALALATIASMLKITSLPFGGSITIFSMLIVCLIGYWYGSAVGITSAIAYGILQFILEPYMIHPAQVLLDYPLAFGALGLAGFFFKKKNGLLWGYLVGVLGRFIFHEISGFIFYTEYVGSFGGNMAALWASTLYNMTYIVPEAIASIILICIPPVKSMLARVKKMAIE